MSGTVGRTSMEQPVVAVGYVRVSTDDQMKGYSLEHQRTVIAAWCAQNGIELLGMCQHPDGGESGKDLYRVGIQQAANLLERHPDRMRYLVVSKIDRLTRSFADGAHLQEILGSCNIGLIAVEDGCTELTGANAFHVSIFAWLAELQRRGILARVHPGQIARLRAGLPINKVPMGYLLEECPRDRASALHGPRQRLVIDLETAPLVQGLFAVAATTNDGLRRLAEWCNEHAIARRLNLSFSPQRVRGMLMNEFYVGTLSVNFESSGEVELFTQVDNHPALIDRTVFRMAQENLSGRRQLDESGINDAKATSWLGGIARCARCNATLTPSITGTHVGIRHYACSNRFLGRCDAPEIHAEYCEARVQLALQDCLGARTADMVEHLRLAIDRLPEMLDQRRTEAAARVREGKDRLSALDGMLEDGLLETAKHSQACAQEHEEITRAEAILAETNGWVYLSRLSSIQQYPGKWRFLPWDIVLHRLALRDRRQLLRAAFSSVIVMSAEEVEVDATMADQGAFIAILSRGYAATLINFPGVDVDALFQLCNWKRTDSPDGPTWADEHGNSVSWRAVTTRVSVVTPPP